MVVEKLHKKVMHGNVTFVGLNFQERVEEGHPKREGNNGETHWSTRTQDPLGMTVPVFSNLTLTLSSLINHITLVFLLYAVGLCSNQNITR